MKKVFCVVFCAISLLFSGCTFDKINNIANQNKKISEEKAKQKEYREKISEADKLIFKEDYEGAMTALKEAMFLNQDKETTLYNRLGFVYHRLKKYSDAFRAFDEAIQLDPKFSSAYENRGDLNYDLENYEEAAADYTKALKLGVTIMFSDRVYMRRGDCYYHLGKYDEAKLDYGIVASGDKYNAEAYFKLGATYAHLGNEEKALENIEKAKKLGYFKED